MNEKPEEVKDLNAQPETNANTDNDHKLAHKDAPEHLWTPPKKGPIGRALAPIAGFGVTFRQIFRPVVTEQYPFEKVPTQPRYHGRHQLNRYADGLEKCIGCELCAWACPADAIYVEAGNNTPEAQFSPGERYGRVYQINYLRCIFCGMCIEACPTRALTMTNDYEIWDDNRADLIYEKDRILAPISQGMLAPPHPMTPGTTDTDYYKGNVRGVSAEQVAWVEENRPSDPTLENAKSRRSKHDGNNSEDAKPDHADACTQLAAKNAEVIK